VAARATATRMKKKERQRKGKSAQEINNRSRGNISGSSGYQRERELVSTI
jgi:hypothetical protein